MDIVYKKYNSNYLDDICEIWNEAINEKKSLPWTDTFPKGKVEYILSTQISCFCATIEQKCIGFYILHPNSPEKDCSVANAMYIVKNEFRNNGIGTALVKHSLESAKEFGFSAMQFNSVVANNISLHIYLKYGFAQIDLIPRGFKINENEFEDLIVLYKNL